DGHTDSEEEHDARERQIDRIEAQIQAAARAVIASIQDDNYDANEDSVLSIQTDESHEPQGTKAIYDGTKLSYEEGTELTYESETDQQSELERGTGGTEITYDSGNEEVSELAKDVDVNFERTYVHASREDGLPRTIEGTDHDIPIQSIEEANEPGWEHHKDLSNDDNTLDKHEFEHDGISEQDKGGDSSSHHDGDIDDDDVFSRNSSNSNRSSLNSCHDLHSGEETFSQKGLTSPAVGEEAGTRRESDPLVLLHVTVLPLQWPYSHLMTLPDLPDTLQGVKENWRSLQDKLGDTVLERGVLLPHPQDSYEVLEERLLEALELPVRPRALILKCGHYMGPGELEASSSEDEGGGYWLEKDSQRKWCDTCRRDVRLESSGLPDQKRFRVKIYASNGLMHAGAWAAAWREMERVDVEIGPWIEPSQHTQLENLAILKPKINDEEPDDGFVDEDVDEHGSVQVNDQEGVENHLVEDGGIDTTTARDINAPQDHDQELESEKVDKNPEEHLEEREKSVADYENEMRELLLEEERMRESHERAQREHSIPEIPELPQPRPRTRRGINEDSLSELLVAAFKVAMRDRKNIALVLLSFLVVILALRPATPTIPLTNSSVP
ncbi:hypothetical protein BJ875DRAFT_348058, partial [Amylocarpus encephaloides]